MFVLLNIVKEMSGCLFKASVVMMVLYVLTYAIAQ